MVNRIARKEGIGAEAAMGSRALSKKYGGEEFAIQVKGLELPGYDPRGSWSMGLAYVTAPRGGCHMSSYPIVITSYSIHYTKLYEYLRRRAAFRQFQDLRR